jgi:hypothetical protein
LRQQRLPALHWQPLFFWNMLIWLSEIVDYNICMDQKNDQMMRKGKIEDLDRSFDMGAFHFG